MEERIIYKTELNQYIIALLPKEIIIYTKFFINYIIKNQINIQTIGFSSELFEKSLINLINEYSDVTYNNTNFHFKLFIVCLNISLKLLNDNLFITYKDYKDITANELINIEKKVFKLLDNNILNNVIESYYKKSIKKIELINNKLKLFSFKEKINNFFLFFKQIFK